MHTESWQALEFSRYVCPFEVDANSLVICISNSGKVYRTIESALCAAQKGANVVGVMGHKSSPLAQACPLHIYTTVPQFDRTCVIPGTYSYTASMMVLTCMAIELGKANGHIASEKAEELYEYICCLGDCIEPTVEADNRMLERYADIYLNPEAEEPVRILHFLGAGPNWGSAQYASEKMLESAAFDSVAQGIEEWAHVQYFTTRKTAHTVILAPRGKSRDRALEICQAITVMDGKKIIVGEENDTVLRRAADIYIPICGMQDIKEAFTPLLYVSPIGLLSMHLGRVMNVQAFSFDKPWVQEENLRQIWESEIDTSYI